MGRDSIFITACLAKEKTAVFANLSRIARKTECFCVV